MGWFEDLGKMMGIGMLPFKMMGIGMLPFFGTRGGGREDGYGGSAPSGRRAKYCPHGSLFEECPICSGGAGQDWWSRDVSQWPGMSNYEQMLDNLRIQSQRDPHQEAMTAMRHAPTFAPEELLQLVGYGNVNQQAQMGPAAQREIRENPALLSALASLGSTTTSAGSGLYGSIYGSEGSRFGTAMSGLGNFRGQDLERYLQEMQLQAQIQMAAMQAQGQAGAMGGGGGFLSDLMGMGSMIMPFIPGLGPYGQIGSMLFNLLRGMGGGGSPGGGIQYSPNFGFGGGGMG